MIEPAYQTAVLDVLSSQGVVAVADQFEIGRYLSKLGCLDSDEAMLRFIAPFLTEEDVLALHSYFAGIRCEHEWRSQFESIFSLHAGTLPPLDPSND
jgi:hypothetical protein